MQLITYIDRFSGDIQGLKSLLDNEFSHLFSGVHLLPFFDPIDGADAGFDPTDHTRVDHRLGDWSDIADLATHYSLMVDLIVNHVSSQSPQFKEVIANGKSSQYWPLFIKKSDVFDSDADDNINLIYRPRPTPPFTKFTIDNGELYEFWTTFSPDQIDINVETPEGQAYLESILDRFAQSGVKEIRLDAAGYAIKRRGTRCFMLPETYEFISELSEKAKLRNMETLVEIHAHYSLQITIAERVGRVYDFALPPLVLHAIYQGDSAPLKKWLNMSPRNCVTVLDTHDGIGILDVAKDGDKPGLLADSQINDLVENIHFNSDEQSREASGTSSSNLDIYQVNCTFYDALGKNDADYLIARAIQFFAPGTPQIYYMGLLLGENDMNLLRQTKVGRDINRHRYTKGEIANDLQRPVVQNMLQLIRLRNQSSAFDGDFILEPSEQHVLSIKWCNQNSEARLSVNFEKSKAMIQFIEQTQLQTYRINNDGLVLQTTEQYGPVG